MEKCEYAKECPFFKGKMSEKPFLTGTYKERYCNKDYPKCARHMVAAALGKGKVPFDLFPDQAPKAEEIIERR
jgi:hypothetical protein